MIVSRFPARNAGGQGAVPSPPRRAELRGGRTSVDEVGVVATCACHKRNAVHSPITRRVKKQWTTTAASVRLGKRKRCQGCLPSLKIPFSMTLRQSEASKMWKGSSTSPLVTETVPPVFGARFSHLRTTTALIV